MPAEALIGRLRKRSDRLRRAVRETTEVDISKFIKENRPPLRAHKLRGLANTALQNKTKRGLLKYVIPKNRHIF
jgi:hypothetical protein